MCLSFNGKESLQSVDQNRLRIIPSHFIKRLSRSVCRICGGGFLTSCILRQRSQGFKGNKQNPVLGSYFGHDNKTGVGTHIWLFFKIGICSAITLTHYRPAMPFGKRKIYFRGSFQFSIVRVWKISPL